MSTQKVHVVDAEKLETVVEFSNPVDEKSPILKPLIEALSGSGVRYVKHYIDISEIYINISSKYSLQGELGRISDFTRSLSVVSNKPLNEQNIKVLMDWSRGTKKWVQEIKQSQEIKLSEITKKAYEKEQKLIQGNFKKQLAKNSYREVQKEREKIETFWKKIFSNFNHNLEHNVR